jgi:hypothetical protein
MSSSQADQLAAAIPAEFHMISVRRNHHHRHRHDGWFHGTSLGRPTKQDFLTHVIFVPSIHFLLLALLLFLLVRSQGSQDKQTSADVFNTGNFQLPNPSGSA